MHPPPDKKRASIVALVGAFIWKIIDFVSNVDFILYLRQRRMAEIFQFVSDYGWICLLLLSVWFYYDSRKNPSKGKPKLTWFTVSLVGIIAFFSGAMLSPQTAPPVPASHAGRYSEEVRKLVDAARGVSQHEDGAWTALQEALKAFEPATKETTK